VVPGGLRFQGSFAGVVGLIPIQETKIFHMLPGAAKNTKTNPAKEPWNLNPPGTTRRVPK